MTKYRVIILQRYWKTDRKQEKLSAKNVVNVENFPVAGWEMGNFCGKYCAREGDMGRLTEK